MFMRTCHRETRPEPPGMDRTALLRRTARAACPPDEAGWRTLVNRIVQDVRRVLPEQSDRSDPSDTLIPQARWLPAPQELPGGLAGL
mgnify:CR=1 FL=1